MEFITDTGIVVLSIITEQMIEVDRLLVIWLCKPLSAWATPGKQPTLIAFSMLEYDRNFLEKLYNVFGIVIMEVK